MKTRYDANPRFRRGQIFKTEAGSELALDRIEPHPADPDYVDSVKFKVVSIAPEDIRGSRAFFYDRPKVGDTISVINSDLYAIGWPRVRYEPTINAASRVAAKYHRASYEKKLTDALSKVIPEYVSDDSFNTFDDLADDIMSRVRDHFGGFIRNLVEQMGQTSQNHRFQMGQQVKTTIVHPVGDNRNPCYVNEEIYHPESVTWTVSGKLDVAKAIKGVLQEAARSEKVDLRKLEGVWKAVGRDLEAAVWKETVEDQVEPTSEDRWNPAEDKDLYGAVASAWADKIDLYFKKDDDDPACEDANDSAASDREEKWRFMRGEAKATALGVIEIPYKAEVEIVGSGNSHAVRRASRVASKCAFGKPPEAKKTVNKDDINVVKASHWKAGTSTKTILHLEMKAMHYLAIYEGGGSLSYGIEVKGSASQVERAYQYEIQKTLEPVGGRTSRVWEEAPLDPAKVDKIINTFVHPTFGFTEEQWGVTTHGDDNTFTDDFEEKEFHKLLKDQLKGWKGGGFGTLVQNHPYWKTFHAMMREEIKKKYGSRITLYRGIHGKQALDILNGAPVKVNRISAWAADKEAAMVYRRLNHRGYWVVVSGVFKAQDILFAPVALPDFIDPNILLVFGRDVEHHGDELVVHSPSGRVNAKVIMKTKKKMASRVAAKYKNKKQVDKADGSGKTTVYEYSKGQVQHRNREKAKRIEKLKSQIGKMRSQLKTDLKNDDPKTKLTALAVCLMDQTCARVGNETSVKERGHFGVTTLQAKHVKIRGGKATLTYKGKSGVDHKKTVTDKATVKALKETLEGKSGSDTILCDGDDCTVRAADVNKYLNKYDVTAKDIRGFRANDEMVRQLDKRRKGKLPEDKKEREQKLKEEFEAALEATAGVVGHEASTLKNQYLVPKMEDQYKRDGTVMKTWSKSASRVADRWAGNNMVRKATPEDEDKFLTAVAKLKVMAKDNFDERKFGLRQINMAWFEAVKHGEVITNDILENKMIPKRDAKGFEMAYRLCGNARKMPGLKRRYMFNEDVFIRWWEKNEKRFDLIVRAIREWGDKSENADAVFSLGSFTIHNALGAEGSDLEGFKKAVMAAERFIKSNGSVVPNFRKVLYGEIFYVPQLTKAHHIAWYDWGKDKVYVRKNKAAWGKSEVHSLIHELGHRYWRKFADKESQFKWQRHYNRVSYERPKVPDLEQGDTLPLKLRGVKRGWRPKVMGVMGSDYIYLTPEGETALDHLKAQHPPTTTSREEFKDAWDAVMSKNPYMVGNIDRNRINEHRGKTEDELTAYPTPYSRQSPEEHFCEALALNCMGTLDQKHVGAFTDIWTSPVSNEELRARGRVASKWLKRKRKDHHRKRA